MRAMTRRVAEQISGSVPGVATCTLDTGHRRHGITCALRSAPLSVGYEKQKKIPDT